MNTLVGIRTGDGDDKIVNTGLIDTSMVATERETRTATAFSRNSVRASVGTGISAGGGNDEVVFGNGF